MTRVDWGFLARMALLVTVFAYVFLLGGGFPSLVDVRLQTISTVLGVAVLGSWLLWRLVHRQQIAFSGMELAIGFFLVTQVVAVAFSEDPRRSLPHTLTWVAYFIVFYSLLDLLRIGWRVGYFEQAVLIGGGVVLAFGLGELAGQFLAWQQLWGLEYLPSFQYRVQSVLGDPNLLAAFTNLLLPLALAKLLTSKWAGKVLAAVFVIAGLVILYFADSRGALLGFGASMGIFAVLWVAVVSNEAKVWAQRVGQFLWRQKAILVALILVVALAAGAFAWKMLSFQGDTTHAPALSARDIYWQAARNALGSDPLTGAGPGMYPVYLMQIWSTPPSRPYLHAHSVPFQVAAESGWLGLSGLAVLVILFLWRAWQLLPQLDLEGRRLWAIGLAGLAGLAAHSVVDDFFAFPAVGVLVMLWMAFVLQGWRPVRTEKRGFTPVWLVAAALAVGAMAIFSLNAYWKADRAISLGAEGEWGLAASLMHSAAEADPGEGIYWLQSGYANARNGEYAKSVVDYSRGIDLEPGYGLNYANLGLAYQQMGEPKEALGYLRIATSLSPEAWQFWLVRGSLEEALGVNEATASYAEALRQEPQIAVSTFWEESSLREEVLAYLETSGTGDTIKEQARQIVLDAQAALNASDLVRAREMLEAAWKLNDQEPAVYTGLAQLAMAEGDLETALRYAQAALWVPATNNQPKIEAVLVAAEIKTAMGDADGAIDLYRTAFEGIMQNSSYGWGSANWTPYAWFVFQRKAFPEDMLPFFFRADISEGIAQRLSVLADLYLDGGMVQEAEEVRMTLAPYMP